MDIFYFGNLNLQYLKMRGLHVSDVGLYGIPKSIRALDCRDCRNVRNAGAMGYWKSLQRLQIGGDNFQLTHRFPVLRSLVQLHVHSNKPFAPTVLGKFPKLEELYIQVNKRSPVYEQMRTRFAGGLKGIHPTPTVVRVVGRNPRIRDY
jgi:hypothetical protein